MPSPMADCSSLAPLPPLHPINQSGLSPAALSTNSLQSKTSKIMDDSIAIAAGDDASIDAVATLTALKRIWDCNMIVWGINARGNFTWTCKHCDQQFAGNNQTKAVHHVLKMSGQSIKLCTAAIPTMYLHTYQDFFNNSFMTRQTRKAEYVSSFFCCLLSIVFNNLLNTLMCLI